MENNAILEKELEPFFTTKAPFQFPANFKEGFTKWWPIVTVILLILTLPVILAILGLGAIMPFSYGYGFATGSFYYLHGIISLVALVLGLLALPGLFNKTRSGWVFSYYSQMLHILGSILTFSIVGIIVGLLFLMLLFQVREYYK